MKLGAMVGMRGDDPAAFARYAKRLEDAGVVYLWGRRGLHGGLGLDAGFLAAVTERAMIGSSIVPLYSRPEREWSVSWWVPNAIAW